MSQEGLINTGPITPFLGENRSAPESRLPLQVSPDAEGIDYRDGTIKKRKGYVRLHQNRISGGGVFIDNDRSTALDMTIVIPADASYFTDEWQVELTVKILGMTGTAPDLELLTCHDGTDGFAINVRYDSGGDTWHFDFISELTGPVTKDISVTLTGNPTSSVYQIWVGRDDTDMYMRVVDEAGAVLSATTAHSAATLIAPSRDFYIGSASGNAPTEQFLSVIVDEFVVWDKGSAASFTPDRFLRSMTVAEQDDADLLGYWPMQDVALNNSVVSDVAGSNDGQLVGAGSVPSTVAVSSMVPDVPSDDGAREFNGVDNLLFAFHNANMADFTDTDLSTNFTLEFWFRWEANPGTSKTLIQIGSLTKPVIIVETDDSIALTLRVWFFRDDANLYDIVLANTTLPVATDHHIKLQCNWASSNLFVRHNGLLTESKTLVGTTNPGYTAALGGHNGIYLGAGYNETSELFVQHAAVKIDEVRFWGRGRPRDRFWDEEVSPSEDDLLWYFRLNAVDYLRDEILFLTGVGSNLQGPTAAVSNIDKPRWSEGLIDDLDSLSDIYGLAPFENPDQPDDLLVLTSSDYWRMREGIIQRIESMASPNTKPWSTTQYRSRSIMTNEHEGVKKYDGERIMQITPDAPDASLVETVLPQGAITGPVSYVFVFKNGGDQSQSVISEDVVTVTPALERVTLNVLPVSTEPQVSILQIYRTQIGSGDARYFFLAEVANGTTTYTDNNIAELAGLPISDALGQPPDARYCGIHQERIFVAEGSQLFFSEVTSSDNPAGWTQFDSRNTIDIRRQDGHDITGFVSTKTGILVSKSNGFFQVLGAGVYSVEKFSEEDGFISHNSIAQSAGWIYGLRRRDVARIPLPLGQFGRESADELQSFSDSNRSVFEGLDEADWDSAVGLFDEVRGEYRVSFVSYGVRIEMVYSEDKGTWSKRALPVHGYITMALTTTAVRKLGAINGYIAELERNDNDGGEVDGTVYTLTGTATGGSVDKLTDTGLADYYGSRFSGLRITVENTAGDKALQERTIYSDYQDNLYVSAVFARAPANGDRYWIAPIDAYWNSASYNFPSEGQDFIGDKKIHRLRLLLRDVSGTVIQLTHGVDGATPQSIDATLDARTRDYATPQRGTEFEFGFRNRNPDEPFDIEALSIIYTEGKKR